MPGDCIGNVDAGEAFPQATEAEVDILHIGAVAFVESIEALEDGAAENACGCRCDRDGRRYREAWGCNLAVAGSPGAGRAADQVVSAVDRRMVGRVKDGAGRE